MFRGRLTAIACIVLALALPSAALADSAGDNQYQDPFANTPAQPKKQKKTQTTPAPTPTAQTSPSASSQPPQNAPSLVPIAHAASGSSSGTLPRTGFPLLPVAAIGAALVAAGLVLRRLA